MQNKCERSMSVLCILKGIKNHWSSWYSLNFKWSKFWLFIWPILMTLIHRKLEEFKAWGLSSFPLRRIKVHGPQPCFYHPGVCLSPENRTQRYSITNFRETGKNKQNHLHHFYHNITQDLPGYSLHTRNFQAKCVHWLTYFF